MSLAGELKELRLLAETTQARVRNLEALLEPRTLAQVIAIKEIVKHAHVQLERLREQVSGVQTAALVESAEEYAYQLYQRLVLIGEHLKIANGELEDEAPQKAASQSVADVRPEQRNGVVDVNAVDGRNISKRERIGAGTRYNREGRARSRSWGSFDSQPASTTEKDAALSSCPDHGHVRYADTIPRSAIKSASRAQSSEEITALPEFPAVLAVAEPRNLNSTSTAHINGRLSCSDEAPLTVAEVIRSCRLEESRTDQDLGDPDRNRKGSLPGPDATWVVLAGIKDENYFLPQLQFIKVHEVKRLKEWLVQHVHLDRSNSISRIEKVLHLLFMLQEGWRIETIAVVFSRTPLQVRDGSLQVFNGLINMYSETTVNRRQPTCHQLWKIARKFTDGGEAEKWEHYYGWKKVDLFSVLVTLNLYIGRYRQQGLVALNGPYQRWWRHLAVSQDE